MNEFEYKLSQERTYKLYKRCRQDGFSERFLDLKSRNKIADDTGLMHNKEFILNAILNDKKNILLFGDTGIGKTTLALNIAFEIKEKNDDNPVFYNRLNMIVSAYKANFSNLQTAIKSVFERDSYYANLSTIRNKVVIIDEVHRCDDYMLLSEIILTAYDSLTPLILIGNTNISDFGKKIDAMVFSRLKENSLIIKTKDLKDLRTGDKNEKRN